MQSQSHRLIKVPTTDSMETVQELVNEWITHSEAGDFGAGIGLVQLSAVLPQGSPEYRLIKSWAETDPAHALARHLVQVLPWEGGWDEDADKFIGDETIRGLIDLNRQVGLATRRDGQFGILNYSRNLQAIYQDEWRERTEAEALAGSWPAAQELIEDYLCMGYPYEVDEAVQLVSFGLDKLGLHKDQALQILEKIVVDDDGDTPGETHAINLSLRLLAEAEQDLPEWLVNDLEWRCNHTEAWVVEEIENMLTGMGPKIHEQAISIMTAAGEEGALSKRRLEDERL